MSALTEADTRAKLIDPAIHARGWSEDFIRREESAGTGEIDPVTHKARRRSRGRMDYVLRHPPTGRTGSVPGSVRRRLVTLLTRSVA